MMFIYIILFVVGMAFTMYNTQHRNRYLSMVNWMVRQYIELDKNKDFKKEAKETYNNIAQLYQWTKSSTLMIFPLFILQIASSTLIFLTYFDINTYILSTAVMVGYIIILLYFSKVRNNRYVAEGFCKATQINVSASKIYEIENDKHTED